MSIRVVRLGTPRGRAEGLRLGTVRRHPRGVPRSQFATRDFYDVWLPELAPSAPLLSSALSGPFSASRWARFERAYRREMTRPPAQHLIHLLAALSARTNLSIGCYCEEESTCHRLLLRQLLIEAGARVVGRGAVRDSAQ